MYSLDVSLDKKSYQVFIKQNIFSSIIDHITNLGDYNKVFVISQKSITDIYDPYFSKNNMLWCDSIFVNLNSIY